MLCVLRQGASSSGVQLVEYESDNEYSLSLLFICHCVGYSESIIFGSMCESHAVTLPYSRIDGSKIFEFDFCSRVCKDVPQGYIQQMKDEHKEELDEEDRSPIDQ
ncbi:hypothetical protein RND81_14G068700 [Saponaria officinalis]|uniref:Uncharacterized protein n=1 Tax=Saponaria officinalis TaxID=3572 RepID=A0AAW1GV25_SAPOF